MKRILSILICVAAVSVLAAERSSLPAAQTTETRAAGFSPADPFEHNVPPVKGNTGGAEPRRSWRVQTTENQSEPDAQARENHNATPQSVRFKHYDVFVDAGDHALAAYQVDISATTGDVKIVGVEGGRHRAFASPPYYDPAAMMNDRVILAAFSTAKDLPAAKTRVARLHVIIAGDAEPEFFTELQTAATTDGRVITAQATIAQGVNK